MIRLVNLSEQNCTDQILTKLADVYTLNKQFSDAMTTFHRALSLNPTSEDALKGLDRLEKLMRGEDPDEMNSTMDQMEPEDNSMETSDYMS
jgi:anaphase-promoting complex subunit 7